MTFSPPSPNLHQWVVPEALVAEEAKAVRMLTDHVKSEIDAGHHTQKETANATIVVWAHKLLNGRCKRSDQEYVLTLMRDEPSDEHENIAPVKQNVPTAFLNLKDRLTAAAAATAKARALQRRQRPASRRGQRACQMARAFGFKYLFFKMSGVAATELCRLLRDAGFFSQLELRKSITLLKWLARLPSQ
ncbi:hypothetical protein T492DRAFT_838005 [Pavlovales sp. CCMP2436]|nr:hypothetical protein T492DRAFT_838005 [Pavlovales sp. CCMP2436]